MSLWLPFLVKSALFLLTLMRTAGRNGSTERRDLNCFSSYDFCITSFFRYARMGVHSGDNCFWGTGDTYCCYSCLWVLKMLTQWLSLISWVSKSYYELFRLLIFKTGAKRNLFPFLVHFSFWENSDALTSIFSMSVLISARFRDDVFLLRNFTSFKWSRSFSNWI